MPKFIVISGNLITKAPEGSKKKQDTLGFGSEVEMSLEDHRAVDPKGERLISPEAFGELKKSADAHRAFLARQKELGASLVELSPKLMANFAALESTRLEALKLEALKKPTKSELPKGK